MLYFIHRYYYKYVVYCVPKRHRSIVDNYWLEQPKALQASVAILKIRVIFCLNSKTLQSVLPDDDN